MTDRRVTDRRMTHHPKIYIRVICHFLRMTHQAKPTASGKRQAASGPTARRGSNDTSPNATSSTQGRGCAFRASFAPAHAGAMCRFAMYFQCYTAEEIGEAVGLSKDGAEKEVSRLLEDVLKVGKVRGGDVQICTLHAHAQGTTHHSLCLSVRAYHRLCLSPLQRPLSAILIATTPSITLRLC